MTAHQRPLLVANRGEIAVRVIDGAHEMGMRTVAVYADPDRDAPHVRAGRRRRRRSAARRRPRPTSTSAKLLDAAAAPGADAIHPGYGFLSENADFARAVVDAGLTWVGPQPDAIARDGRQGRGQAPRGRARRARAAERRARRRRRRSSGAPRPAAVGYPLLVKAAAGGGGRGMRLVLTEDELDEAVDGAPAARPWPRSATARCSPSAASPRPATSRSRSSATSTATSCTSASASARSSAGTRSSSRRRPSPAVDEVLREQLGAAAVALARGDRLRQRRHRRVPGRRRATASSSSSR